MQVLTANRQLAAAYIPASGPPPSLASLIAISIQPNELSPGYPFVSPPNFGLTSTRQPDGGWFESIQLDLAAGPAPRDTHVPVYILTPNPPQSRYELVPAVDMINSQSDKLQVIATGPVGYVPGGVAVLSPLTSEQQLGGK